MLLCDGIFYTCPDTGDDRVMHVSQILLLYYLESLLPLHFRNQC